MTEKISQMTEALKLYIEVCMDSLKEYAAEKRTMVNFNTLYEFSGIKIKYLRELFENDIAFQAKIKNMLREINKDTRKINKLRYQLKKDVYLRSELPEKRRNQTDFLRFIDAWNQGERDKKKLAKIADKHLDTIYEWLKELD